MRIPSAYQVYRVIFDYHQASEGTRVAFGRAIADTLPVLCEVMGSDHPAAIEEYRELRYARPLATQFQDHFLELASRRSTNFICEWRYVSAEITLDRSLFPFSRKRGLDINFPFLIGPDQCEIIIPTFGPAKNMSGELGVLMTLCDLGTVKPGLPGRGRTITYWNLLNGTEHSVEMADIVPADTDRVLAACHVIMAD